MINNLVENKFITKNLILIKQSKKDVKGKRVFETLLSDGQFYIKSYLFKIPN